MDIYPSYTYYLRWTSQNKSYYGVRTANKAAPEDDLWTYYFTSSKSVAAIREEHGDPDVILVDEVFETREEAVAYEMLFLKKHDWKSDIWLNQACFPVMDVTGMKHTEEARQKVGEFNKGKRLSAETKQKIGAANRGKVLSKETRQKIGLYQKTRKRKLHTDEAKAKMSVSLRGRRLSEETKQKLSEANKGKRLSEEHKRKISESHKGKVFSEETKRKMSEAAKKRSKQYERKNENVLYGCSTKNGRTIEGEKT